MKFRYKINMANQRLFDKGLSVFHERRSLHTPLGTQMRRADATRQIIPAHELPLIRMTFLVLLN